MHAGSKEKKKRQHVRVPQDPADFDRRSVLRGTVAVALVQQYPHSKEIWVANCGVPYTYKQCEWASDSLDPSTLPGGTPSASAGECSYLLSS
jgi:hypothetical protein